MATPKIDFSTALPDAPQERGGGNASGHSTQNDTLFAGLAETVHARGLKIVLSQVAKL
jgi:hypothetical protein